MIFAVAVAASLATQPPTAAPADPAILTDASHAIDAGRLKEAKLIIARAVSEGLRGAPIERLTADLAFASEDYLQAWSLYQHLVASPDKQPRDCEKGAIAALQLGKVTDAQPLIDCAIASPNPSWRTWNARGVLADFKHDWPTADDSYARAHDLAPGEAQVANNEGWSKLIRGDWAGAIPLFERAAMLDGKSERIANNLELARMALASDLPERRAGESNEDWAVRLNDAGVAAELLGDRQRAVAAFTQALDASPIWYDRASNNLATLGAN